MAENCAKRDFFSVFGCFSVLVHERGEKVVFAIVMTLFKQNVIIMLRNDRFFIFLCAEWTEWSRHVPDTRPTRALHTWKKLFVNFAQLRFLGKNCPGFRKKKGKIALVFANVRNRLNCQFCSMTRDKNTFKLHSGLFFSQKKLAFSAKQLRKPFISPSRLAFGTLLFLKLNGDFPEEILGPKS